LPRILTGPLTRALVIENPHPSLDELLQADGIEVTRVSEVPDEDELIALLRGGRHQILFKRSRVPVTARVVQAADDLVAVQLCSIGHDSVDKEACARRGVLVFNDPVSNGRSVVELAIGHMIGLSRRLYETHIETRGGVWEKSASARYEVRGKVLGLLGLGKIGRSVARVAEALGLEIRFYDSREVAREVGTEMGWELVEELDSLFAGSDIVSVHTSAQDALGRSNAGLISESLLLKLGAERPENSPRLFINLARGNLHSAEALLAAVDTGRVRRAAVDVYPAEPRGNGPGWENPYAAEPRIMSTPHIGAATQEAQPRIARHVATTQRGFSSRGSIRDCVFSPQTRIAFGAQPRGGAVLTVVHSTERGTKKALDDAIYEAGASNLRSQHRDFPRFGIALDVNLLDRPLNGPQLRSIVDRTRELTGDALAVRLVRQLER